ncbi:hypothetical protein MSAN_01874800 [Mycena sanguinolenta]|uniref:Uncharacterized protein n=1 Tax=Mycena sanguinolenta TaxID=230812 RepID=A0A8H7CT38_9AGAR|nr:hypothetical protein MSAN_01874800 [Mycena sanguinolenta]
MHFLKVAALALFPLVLSAPSPRQSTAGTIVQPADGTVIAPGETFPFQYESVADYGISSYNFTVWLLTSMPSSFGPAINFAEGHYFGRFAEPNYPGNPSPTNPPPATLTMPDFSKNPAGFGTGSSDSNGAFALVVMEEYATGEGSVGLRFALAMNQIVYNGTTTS